MSHKQFNFSWFLDTHYEINGHLEKDISIPELKEIIQVAEENPTNYRKFISEMYETYGYILDGEIQLYLAKEERCVACKTNYPYNKRTLCMYTCYYSYQTRAEITDELCYDCMQRGYELCTICDKRERKAMYMHTDSTDGQKIYICRQCLPTVDELKISDLFAAGKLVEVYGSYMRLKIFVDPGDPKLIDVYKQRIWRRNNSMRQTSCFKDMWFNICSPATYTYKTYMEQGLIRLNVRCSAYIVSPNRQPQNTGFNFNVHSRSNFCLQDRSTYNVHHKGEGAMLSVRGNVVDNLRFDDKIVATKFEALAQIYAPNLEPILVELVDNEDDLYAE